MTVNHVGAITWNPICPPARKVGDEMPGATYPEGLPVKVDLRRGRNIVASAAWLGTAIEAMRP